MSITDVREKCKSILARLRDPSAKLPRDVLTLAILIFASSLSFGFGYLAGRDAGEGSRDLPIQFSSLDPLEAAPAAAAAAAADPGQVVASKNGTKYYLPSCSGVSRISEANKVWFPSAAAARAQGYEPAANCKGL